MGLEGSRSSRHGRDRWKMNVHGILLAAQNVQEKHTGTPTLRADSSFALLRRSGQESSHEHDEGSGQPKQFGRNGEDHGSSTGYRVPQF